MASPGEETESATKVEEEKYVIIDELIELCLSNLEFYKKDNTIVGSRMFLNFEKLKVTLEKSLPVIKEIEKFAPQYDFDENTPGNGYRSFVYIFDCANRHSIKVCRYVSVNRGNLLFRKSFYMKEIETCSQIVESLLQICVDLIEMHQNSENGNLYSKEYSHDNMITRAAKVVNQVCFYGRAIGFQYCNSMKPILRFLAISMASFSESYFSNRSQIVKSTASIFTSSKYFMDPEMCAQRIVSVSHNAKIDFCKSFWFLAEGKVMHSLPSIVGYKVEVNKVFKIPPEPLKIYSTKLNDFVNIPIPTSHLGKAPVSCRLLSARYRKGMVGEKSNSFKTGTAELSKYLIIQSHGGGWVAQSSKSHELYLREWAVKMDVPIISIDYSLAPEAPFPRGFEDVFYAYCWCLKNIELLGSTGENIVMVGDSAGGNINTACVVKCIEMGIPKPRGLFNAYCPFLVNFASSPARFLSLVDPLLPYGFIMRVFKTYGAAKEGSEEETKVSINMKHVQSNLSNEKHEIVSNLYDDVEDANQLLSPDSSKALESMWLNIKSSTESPDWQTNLGSIKEIPTPSEEITSEPFVYRRDSLIANENINGDDDDDDDDDILEMKSSRQEKQAARNNIDKPHHFVNDFLEKYDDGKDIDEPQPRGRLNSKTPSEENIVLDIGMDTFSVQNIHERIQKATNSFVDAISSPFKQQSNSNRPKDLPLKRNFAFDEKRDTSIPKAPDDEFVFSVPKNYFMSPYWAPDEILKEFPPTKILTILLDPCLDDCVEFSKKLKRLGVNIHLDVTNGLVHGFLNFAQVSKESHDASMLCMQRIAELLDLPLQKMD